MFRLIIATLALSFAVPGPAGAKEASRVARKPVKAPAAPLQAAPSRAGNINAPSTDFSTVERADGDDAGSDKGGGMRPVMGSGGGIGLGGGF